MHWVKFLFCVFERLQGLVGDTVTSTSLRSYTYNSAQIAMSYIDRHTFVELRKAPWNLVGDTESKLKRLASSGKQDHPVADKLQRFVKTGYPIKELIAVVHLLSLVKWSTLAVEQAHAAVALMRKYHQGYSVLMIVSRGFCYLFWKLVRRAPQDGQLYKLGRKLQSLLRSYCMLL